MSNHITAFLSLLVDYSIEYHFDIVVIDGRTLRLTHPSSEDYVINLDTYSPDTVSEMLDFVSNIRRLSAPH